LFYFKDDQLWRLDENDTKLKNKSGLWRSSFNWSFPTEEKPGKIENLSTKEVLFVDNDGATVVQKLLVS
jgi:hypothetical protein